MGQLRELKDADTYDLISRNTFKLQDLIPHNNLTEDKSHISNLCQFGWFE